MIYLQANRSFNKDFHYDMSGLEVSALVPDQPLF